MFKIKSCSELNSLQNPIINVLKKFQGNRLIQFSARALIVMIRSSLVVIFGKPRFFSQLTRQYSKFRGFLFDPPTDSSISGPGIFV
eukprot:UN26107